MKIIGILGGMGPASGIHFAQKLVALNAGACTDSEHVPFVLHSDPRIPQRVDAFLHGQASPVPSIAAALGRLALLGADFAVMVCNTAHIYFDDIAARSPLPLVDMIDNTVAHVRRTAPARVALLATAATVRSGLYARRLAAANCELVVPSESDQELLGEAIFDPRIGIKATGMCVGERARSIVQQVATHLRRRTGARHVLLGCTELSLLSDDPHWRDMTVIDPVTLLAQRCLTESGG